MLVSKKAQPQFRYVGFCTSGSCPVQIASDKDLKAQVDFQGAQSVHHATQRTVQSEDLHEEIKERRWPNT